MQTAHEAALGEAGDAPAPWPERLERADRAWQRLEAHLCAIVVTVEIATLTFWVLLRGLATEGATAHWASNLLNCLQNASVLMLVGGLRGLATRLTLWVALLGASLATSRGKHIHVDVLIRYLPVPLRVPTAVLGSLLAAIVCVAGAAGFVDYIGIAAFRISATRSCDDDPGRVCQTPASEKLATMERIVASDLFLLERQASLDVRSLPRVIAGVPYDGWLHAREWNAWLDDADWSAHFPKSAIDALRMDASTPHATRMPQVTVPEGGEARGLLIRELDLVFPFGLLVISLKFLLRIARVITTAVRVDTDAEAVHVDRDAEAGLA